MRTAVTLVTLLALVAAGLALTLVRPQPLPRTLEVAPPTSSKLVCAPMGEPGQLYVDGANSITPLGQGDGAAAAGPTLVAEQSEPSVIRGGSSLLGGMLVVGTGNRSWTPCTAPTSQGALVVPGTASTDLLVVNPDASEAVVDLSLYGSDGEIVALGARGITVAPHSARTVALSVLAEQDGPVGVAFRASRGRATVVARTATADGVLAAVTASAEGTRHQLAGVPTDATTVSLLVTNPGNERASVDVTAHGASVAYQPAGSSDVSVPAHSSVVVDLGTSLAGEATGLLVTSQQDVAVTLSTGTGTDLAFAAPVDASPELGAYAPAGGVLQLSNPGDAEVQVSVLRDVIDGESTTTQHTVPAGSTVALPLAGKADRGQVVDVTADGALYGAIVEAGAGISIVALSSTAQPDAEPLDAEIVPTLR